MSFINMFSQHNAIQPQLAGEEAGVGEFLDDSGFHGFDWPGGLPVVVGSPFVFKFRGVIFDCLSQAGSRCLPSVINSTPVDAFSVSVNPLARFCPSAGCSGADWPSDWLAPSLALAFSIHGWSSRLNDALCWMALCHESIAF